jgi:hypothetical protein
LTGKTRSFAIAPLLLTIAGCPSPRIDRFDFSPSCVCAGGHSEVAWSATRRGHLSASPAPSGWSDALVDDHGTRDVAIDEDTSFTFAIPGANPADATQRRDKVLKITPPNVSRGIAVTACDAATKTISGALQSDASCGAVVRRYRDASVVESDGTTTPRAACLASPDHVGACDLFAESAPMNTPVVAGTRVVMRLDDDESCADGAHPKLLAITIDLACSAAPK